jgi:DNA-binding XRE family transcriptional regulator
MEFFCVYYVQSAEQTDKNKRKESKMGHKLKEFREAKGLTQEELADKANVSRTTIWSLETNPDVQTTTKTLVKIAEALESTVGEIFFANDVQSTVQEEQA